jgi:hypothetical protein
VDVNRNWRKKEMETKIPDYNLNEGTIFPRPLDA